MAEGRSSKKRPVVEAPRDQVARVAGELRDAAARLEKHQPLYESFALSRLLAGLEEGLERFRREELEAHRVLESTYLRHRAAWLRAWQRSEPAMRERVDRLLGRLPEPEEDEPETGYRLRVLVFALETIPDETAVAALCEEVPGSAGPAAASGGHTRDPEAKEALLTWGQMELAEFLEAWPAMDPGLVDRACAMVGIAHKRVTLATKKRLHATAVRFYRNTRF